MTVSLDDLRQANPALRDYIDAGLLARASARRTLEVMREAGHAIRTEDFYRAWAIRERAIVEAGLACFHNEEGNGNGG